RTEVLDEVLRDRAPTDFGRDVIPAAIGARRVFGYPFSGYWADLGTIRTYHRANLHLAEEGSGYDFFIPDDPVFTRPRFLPASKVLGARLESTLLAEGCIVEPDVNVRRAVLGLRSVVRRGSKIADTVILGASTYEKQAPREKPRLGIGEHCTI